MAGITFEQQIQIRDAIKEYLDKNGVTSLRLIADYVKQKTGMRPSPNTISRHVREAGYKRSGWEREAGDP